MSGVHRSARISDARATGQYLLVFLHATSCHGRMVRTSSKIEPNQSDRCTSAGALPPATFNRVFAKTGPLKGDSHEDVSATRKRNHVVGSPDWASQRASCVQRRSPDARTRGGRQRRVLIATPWSSVCFDQCRAHADDAVMEWNRIAFAATVTRGSGARSPDTDHGHRPGFCARRGERDHLRLPDLSLDPLRSVGNARSGGDWRGPPRTRRPVSRTGCGVGRGARGVARRART